MNKKIAIMTLLASVLLVLIGGCSTQIKDEKIIISDKYYFIDLLNISCSIPKNLIAEINKLEWIKVDSSTHRGSPCEAISPECTLEIYLFESDNNSLRHRIHYFGSPDNTYHLIYYNRNYRCFKEEVTTMKNNTKDIESSCFSNNECKWVSTNCCPESGGAKWECINEDKSIISCPEESGCYQFVSQKPTQNCACINNQCQQEIPDEKYCEKDDDCITSCGSPSGFLDQGSGCYNKEFVKQSWNEIGQLIGSGKGPIDGACCTCDIATYPYSCICKNNVCTNKKD